MAIGETDLGIQIALLEQAGQTFHNQYARLFDGNGQARYQPAEHQCKEAEMTAPLEVAQARALEVAAQAETEISAALAQLDHVDPLVSLKGDDLTRASALLPLVKETITGLDEARLFERVQGVIASGDRAAMVAYAVALPAGAAHAAMRERLEAAAYPERGKERERLTALRRQATTLGMTARSITRRARYTSGQAGLEAYTRDQLLASGRYGGF